MSLCGIKWWLHLVTVVKYTGRQTKTQHFLVIFQNFVYLVMLRTIFFVSGYFNSTCHNIQCPAYYTKNIIAGLHRK